MTLYLRDKNNNSIVDLDLWKASNGDHKYVEISSTISLNHCSLLLISESDKRKQLQMIIDFDSISELRGWLWETYCMNIKNTHEIYNDVLNEIKQILINIGKKYNLYLVTD